MANTCFKASLILPLVVLCGSSNAAGPPSEQRERLASFADRIAEQQEQQRTQAIDRARGRGLFIQRTLGDGRQVQLRHFQRDKPVYLIETNLTAAATVSVDKLWPAGALGLNLDGSGELLGIWDGGSVRTSHQEFTGRVSAIDGSGQSNHATHVAGTMVAAGVVPSAKGMSYAANLRSRDWNSDTSEMAADQLLPQPVSVSNHSYGFVAGWIFNWFGDGLWTWFGDVAQGGVEDSAFGFYSSTAANWDQLVVDSPNYIIVQSAGNDRDDAGTTGLHWHYNSAAGSFETSTDFHPADGSSGGYDTIGAGATSAKNILTIAAVGDIPGGYGAPGDVVMSSFSGWGPTDDGRIKPDLSANGVGVYSSLASSDSAYASYNGTSMSSPNAAGALGLLTQHARNLYGAPLWAATMKALAINTADEAGPAVGPDYSFGWGLLNAATAAQLMSNDAASPAAKRINEISLANGSTHSIDVYSDGTAPLRVTAAWTDPAGTPPANTVDPVDLMLVNDLDIRVIDPLGGSHLPWTLDPGNPSASAVPGDNFRDNVEQVHIAAPMAGTYQVQISHKGTLAGGSPQDLGLVISGVEESAFSADTTLVLGVLDTGAYGNGYGSDEHETELQAAFEFTGTDLLIQVTGYDIDSDDEVSVYLNDELIGYLSEGPNNGHNSGDVFAIPASAQDPGTNVIRFEQRTAGWIWGVTDLLLIPAAIELTPGVEDNGEYGNRYGSDSHESELVALFESTGSDLILAVTGYDIDYEDEVSVFLNDVFIGYLSTGPNNRLNDGDTFAIPAAAQDPGTNEIRFEQRTTGWTWGVSDLLLFPAVVELTPGTRDRGKYGNGYGSDAHESELVAVFEYTGIDLNLSLTGYDIDVADEVAVYLNGGLLGYLSEGPNNGLNSGDVFAIPETAQFAGSNEIRFVQKTVGWKWGVADLLLSSAGEVTLLPEMVDEGHYGNRHGTDSHPLELVASFDGTTSGLLLTVTGFDIDDSDEVSVFLNGALLGNLTEGENNEHNRGDVFAIPAALQLASNELRFVEKTAGWKWGVTELELTQGDVVLTPEVPHPGEYGNRYGSSEHRSDLLASFTSPGTDLHLSVTGYDIDFVDEVAVYLNGNLLGYLNQGPNNALNGGEVFSIPLAQQVAGINHIRFVQKTPGWTWGVSGLLLSSAAP